MLKYSIYLYFNGILTGKKRTQSPKEFAQAYDFNWNFCFNTEDIYPEYILGINYFIKFFMRSSSGEAHVKWFSNFDFQQAPLHVSDLGNIYFWGLLLLSLVSLPLIVYIDRRLEISSAYLRINKFLDRYAEDGLLVMRIIVGAVLLMSWQGDSIIAPEIPIPSNIWGWIQFILIFLLFFKETIWITGLGMILFYGVSVYHHGIFHMLDYVIYPAVGLYFVFSCLKSEKMKNLDLPILYSGLGFSLCWVAFEKLMYPHWGLSVLSQAPELTMGFDHRFFLTATAFVEFTLGYLLIICLLQRPLAILITLVFFTTSVFFGKTEVIGHTILHGALLVFMAKGPGHYYQAPIRIHKSPWMRSLFASINYVILFAVMAFTYDKLASKNYLQVTEEKKSLEHPRYIMTSDNLIPTVVIHSKKDFMGGWDLHFITTNFNFTPENAGGKDVPNTGHGHLYVDGKKVARVYSNWFHLDLPKGHHQVKFGLTTNSHKDYYYSDHAIEAHIELDEENETNVHIH
jgi:uncharacterized membrane protein YphA (DoxX/SURF4 family)